MNKPCQYAPCNFMQRLGAVVINFFFLGALNLISKSLQPSDEGIFILYSVCVLGVILCCAFPESPGKRILNLRILSDFGEPNFQIRLIRSLPYLVLFTAMILRSFITGFLAETILSLVYLSSLVFILANFVTILFSPTNLSLLDMKLSTRVVARGN